MFAMNADELIALNEQIAGMARAGLPLDQGLASLAGEMHRGRLRRVTEAIVHDLKNGSTLPEAVARRNSELPPYYAHLITAGVRTGRLPDVLATLTAYARSIATTRGIIIDSLFYPIVVFLFAIVLLSTLVFFVLPQFDKIFRDFQMKLPALTAGVLAIGQHPYSVFIMPLSIIVVSVIVVWLWLHRTERGRRIWALGLYSIPVVGTLVRSARLSAFAELLAVLVDFELPLPEALRLAGMASSDPLMKHEATGIHDRLVEGARLGEVLRGRGLLPEWVAWMAAAGEQRGALSATLRQIAALYRRQVDSRAALLRSVFPAFMIIFTAGLLTATFAFSVMLPMIRLVEGLSK
jgi:type II secretory pathway component PulF